MSRLLIAGVNRWGRVAEQGGGALTYDDTLNARTTLTAKLVDPTNTLDIDVGLSVAYHDGDDALTFGGTVDTPTLELLGDKTQTNATITVPCVSYDQLADRFTVAASYPSQAAGVTMRDLVNTYLNADSVDPSGIQDGPILPALVFNYIALSACFDKIAQLANMAWRIDPVRVAFLEDAATAIVAPWSITDAAYHCQSLRRQRSRATYRNVQFVVGGNDVTDAQTEFFKGDGTNQTFVTAYPLNATPDVFVNAVAQTVGIRGVTTGAQWYWNASTNQISQDSAGTPLTSSDTLKVVYLGLFPIVTVAQDDAAIAERQSVEGGSGRYENTDIDQTINSQALALGVAQSLLAGDNVIKNVITVVTQKNGLRAGMIQTINVTKEGLDGDFLITSVRGSDVFGDTMTYTVTLIDAGKSLQQWQHFFKALFALKAQGAADTANNVVLLLRTIADAVALTDSLAAVSAGPESRVGFATIGFSEVA